MKTKVWAAFYHLFQSLEWFTAKLIKEPVNAPTTWCEFNKPFGELRLAIEPKVRTDNFCDEVHANHNPGREQVQRTCV